MERVGAVTVVRAFLLQGGLIPALKDVLNAESDLAEVEGSHDAKSLHEEMDALTQELHDLLARGTPRVTRAGGRLRSGVQTPPKTRATGKRGASSGGGGEGATRGKASKKKRSSEAAAATPRSRSAKRARRSS